MTMRGSFVTAAVSRLARLPVWLQWTLATAVGFTAGELLLEGALLMSVLSVFLIAALQWLILWRYFQENALWWVAATLAGWIVFNLLGRLQFINLGFKQTTVAGLSLELILFAALFGLCVGVAQGIFLRQQHVAGAMLWPAVSTFGFSAGAFVNTVLARLLTDSVQTASNATISVIVFLNLIIAGLTAGAITGLMLERLIRRSLRFARKYDTQTTVRVLE